MSTVRRGTLGWGAAPLFGVMIFALGCGALHVPRLLAPSNRLHALLLSGGGDPANNYQSHLTHIRSMVDVLRPAVRTEDITIFSGDGSDPSPDLATRAPAVEPNFWLLPQASVGKVLQPPIVYVNSSVEGFTLRPARKDALRAWFEHEGKRLHGGDTLLFYVTDHGEENKDDPENNTITLWGETLSVIELQALLAQLDPQVRVVMLMSQCFSGAFARAIFPAGHDAEPRGNVCGYFAVTATRPAYGCYAENRGQEGIGHSYQFVEALRQLGNFPEAHQRVLVADGTPDVPHTSIDYWLQQHLQKEAQDAGMEFLPLVDELLSEAWQNRAAWEPEIRLLDRIGRTFGTFSPRSLAEIDEQARTLPELSQQMNLYSARWHEALDALRIENLLRFIDAHPSWHDRFDLKQIATLDAESRRATTLELLTELTPFSGTNQRLDRLKMLRERADDTAATTYRNEVRVGAVLRMRALLISIAGRQYIMEHGTDAERAALQRLTRCEDLVLNAHPPVTAAADLPAPNPFPPLADEQRFVQAAMPAWIGVQYRPLSVPQRAAHHTGSGAVAVTTVYPDSPASAAGLQLGDLILGHPGAPFTETHQLREEIMRSDVGTPVRLQVLRNGRSMQITLRPGPFPVELPKLPGPPQVGRVAPPIKVDFVQGASRLAANRPRLLFFWATWCKICHSSLPELMAFSAATGVELVAITDEDPVTVRRFLTDFSSPFPAIVASDPYRLTFERFGVSGTPTFVLLDEQSVVRHYQTGYAAAAGLTIEGWKWEKRASAK